MVPVSESLTLLDPWPVPMPITRDSTDNRFGDVFHAAASRAAAWARSRRSSGVKKSSSRSEAWSEDSLGSRAESGLTLPDEDFDGESMTRDRGGGRGGVVIMVINVGYSCSFAPSGVVVPDCSC